MLGKNTAVSIGQNAGLWDALCAKCVAVGKYLKVKKEGGEKQTLMAEKKWIKDPTALLLHAIIVLVLASAISYVFGLFVPTYFTGIWGQVVFSALIVIAIIAMLPYAKVDNLSIVPFFVFLSLLAVLGTVITQFLPASKFFILSISYTVTLSGLMFTVFYIMLAETVKGMAKK